ncbi:MAG: MCP four helix bundle domain-containing protein [Burkholderiaceae bacterium]|nr:MCP four helix bundle domain-containing protein [Burkholderiaceae bacterium]
MNTLNLKIGTRLALAFGATLILTVTLGVVSLWQTSLMKNSYEFVSTNTLLAVRAMANMSSALETMRRSELRYSSLSPQGALKEEDAFNEAVAELKKNSDAYMKVVGGEAKAKAFGDAFNAKFAAYMETHRKLLDMNQNAGTDPAKQDDLADYLYYGDNFKANNEARDALKASVEYSHQQAEVHREDAVKSYNEARGSMLFFALLNMAVGTALAVWITRVLLKQLGCEPHEAVEIAGRIAEGDLTTAIDIKSGDSASLLFAIKAMRDSIVTIVSQVRNATDTISTGSHEIARGNMDLSARTEAQAGALEETASSMEELTSTVKQNADNARQANKLAQTASEVAVKGGAVVSQVVDTMGSINDSAKKIVDIISVIDSIAFQTNILALNAAVEAARAGEQGRGFAVVAAEVRNLAQRSAGAAKEIKELIGDSVEKVGAGSKLVDQAGSTMDEVVASIRRVTDIVSEITAASTEQTAGIEEVNKAIGEMDSVTQQNAALVEEAAAAAASMQDQAATLVQVVGVFKLNEAQGAAGRPSVSKNGLAAAPAARPTQLRVVEPVEAESVEGESAAPTRGAAMVNSTDAAGNSADVWEEF